MSQFLGKRPRDIVRCSLVARKRPPGKRGAYLQVAGLHHLQDLHAQTVVAGEGWACSLPEVGGAFDGLLDRYGAYRLMSDSKQ